MAGTTEKISNPSIRILFVFIHGFRGSDITFEGFPEQMRLALSHLLPNAHINLAVYPQFETKGSLVSAVDGLLTWLKGIESHRRSQPNGSEPLLTILVGHSMGGLLACDAYLKFKEGKEGAKISTAKPMDSLPEILGVISFETPYYGLNRSMFAKRAITGANSLTAKMGGAVTNFMSGPTSTSRSDGSTPLKQNGNMGFKLAIGGLAVAAMAAGAFLYKDELGLALNNLVDHLEFVNELNKPKQLASRVKTMVEDDDCIFHCFYVETPIESEISRFILLPGENGSPTLGSDRFTGIRFQSKSELQGHARMFNPKVNTSYYEMAKQAVALAHYAILSYQARTQHQPKPTNKPDLHFLPSLIEPDLELD